MLFAPKSVPAQAYAQDFSRPASQIVILNASPTRPADYQLLDDRIRVIHGFSAFSMDSRDLCLIPNVVLPQNFKVQGLPKYKGLSYHRSHVTMYLSYPKIHPIFHNDHIGH